MLQTNGSSEIKVLGYDERYCGFKHTTTVDEHNEVNERRIQYGDVVDQRQCANNTLPLK